MAHLSDEDIDALVQYNKQNNVYFDLTEERAKLLNEHIKECDICNYKYKQSYEIYSKVRLNKSSKLYKSIAIFLISGTFILYLLNQNSLNSDYYLTYHDFEFMVARGYEQDSLNSVYTNLILKHEYDRVIELCEVNRTTKNNLYYIAALVFKAQNLDEPKYLDKSIKMIESDSLSSLKQKILKLVE